MWIQTSAAARQSWPGISRERRLYRSRSASESECVTPRRGNGDHLAVWSSLNILNIVSLTLRRSDFCLLEAKHKTRRNVDGIETIRCGFLRRMG
ncbi:hypothetical protein Y032_0005g2550 [Ancylostoma ceylanicum]|uniref:Uncharacterized protein n=1 Tax=Ancylostoma ceylanicum TaxID=53326 RepID=A0A016VS78_9BILA|nr:hypothetical protein Y032_0005g2550 [Ancylostoma ceylanicum]